MTTESIRAKNIAKFFEVYTPLLRQAQIDYPREYGDNPPAAEHVAARMAKAMLHNEHSKDGRAMKATCKALGIPHTYKGIEEYLRGGK